MSKRLLPLIPAGLVVDQVDLEPDQIIIRTHPRATAAACPGCGDTSARPHSRYTRTLADLPWQGRRVDIAVQTRRWRCSQPHCPRRVFAERLTTTRLSWIKAAIAHRAIVDAVFNHGGRR